MNISLERVLKFPRNFVIKERFSPTGTNQPAFDKSHHRVAVAIFFFCQGLCFATWASRIPDLKLSLGLSEAILGTILLALPAGQMLAMPFSGRLVARYGSRTTLAFGFLLYALSLTNIGLTQNPVQLAMALFLFGIAGNLCNISVNTQAVGVEKLYGRPIMSSFHGVWSTAGFSGALLGLLMMKYTISPYQHFWTIALVCGTATMIAQRFLVTGRSPIVGERKRFFSKPDTFIIQLGLIGFCCMASEGTMFDWSGVYFQKIIKAEGAMITLGYASFMIMMAAGRFLGDRAQLKIGKKKLLQISGALISSGLFISVFFPYIVPATIGFIIVGLGVSSVIPIVYSTAGKSTTMPPSIALASVSSISYLGFLMGPPIIGFIAELTDLRFSFATIGLLGFLISLMVTRLKIME